MKHAGSLRVSIIQAAIAWTDKKKNLENFEKEIDKLKDQTDLIVLPEMFSTGFAMDTSTVTEPMDGMVMEWMVKMAQNSGSVIAGSIAINEKGKYYNRLVWMRPDGSYEYTDKRHLFRMAGEHEFYTGGKKRLIVELKGWKIRPLICYDLRFPVWSKNRMINGKYEYDLLIYVASWPASRSYAWKALLQARAIENQSPCVGVNRIGKDGKGIPHSGNSMIVDCKGRSLITIPANKPFTGTALLDYQELEAFRKRFAVGLDWDEFTIK